VNRRSGSWFVRILFALALVVGPLAPQVAQAAAPATPPAEPGSTEPATTANTVPTDEIVIDEANPFLPETRDLTDCVGMLQRPGCGSEARGGWHQDLVAIAMVGGLLIVFGRVAWAVRRSQKNAAASATDS
jgi:hypothetical protein